MTDPFDTPEAKRDKDWILAIALALGTNSGFQIPIVPEPDEFKKLFAALRERSTEKMRTAIGDALELFDRLGTINVARANALRDSLRPDQNCDQPDSPTLSKTESAHIGYGG